VIEGSTNSLSAPNQARNKGTNWVFQSWSDGGAATHDVVAKRQRHLHRHIQEGASGNPSGTVTAPSPAAWTHRDPRRPADTLRHACSAPWDIKTKEPQGAAHLARDERAPLWKARGACSGRQATPDENALTHAWSGRNHHSVHGGVVVTIRRQSSGPAVQAVSVEDCTEGRHPSRLRATGG
jgi:hypothetical protein